MHAHGHAFTWDRLGVAGEEILFGIRCFYNYAGKIPFLQKDRPETRTCACTRRHAHQKGFGDHSSPQQAEAPGDRSGPHGNLWRKLLSEASFLARPMWSRRGMKSSWGKRLGIVLIVLGPLCNMSGTFGGVLGPLRAILGPLGEHWGHVCRSGLSWLLMANHL